MRYVLALLCVLNLGFFVWCRFLPASGGIASSVLAVDADEVIKTDAPDDRSPIPVQADVHAKIGALELQVVGGRRVQEDLTRLSHFKSLAYPMFLVNAGAAFLAVLALTPAKSSANARTEPQDGASAQSPGD